MTRPIDLIIDCDPGIDDALALWLAAARPDRFHLLAVTTVAGNRPAGVTCDNAIRLLDAAGLRQVPVYRGAGEPLSGQPARCNLVHGVDGLGGVQLPLQRSARPKAAWQYLLRALNNHPPQSLTLAAIGPLTNLALAEAHQPLGGQAVIVKPHGVEDVFTRHALEARDEISLRVAIHMPHMQRAAYRWRRCVDNVVIFARFAFVPCVGFMVQPMLLPFFFNRCRVVLLGQGGHFMCVCHRR